jgi:early secretory antigenic target protein ESAT-6
MSGDIFINYSGVNNVIEDMQSANNAIQGVLNNLQDEIQPLRATWAGTSEDAWVAVQNRWDADMADMNRVLSQASVTLGDMSSNTANTDNNVAAGWQGIH